MDEEDKYGEFESPVLETINTSDISESPVKLCASSVREKEDQSSAAEKKKTKIVHTEKPGTSGDLSEDEENHFAFISEQLNILNENSADTGKQKSDKSSRLGGKAFFKAIHSFKRFAKGKKRRKLPVFLKSKKPCVRETEVEKGVGKEDATKAEEKDEQSDDSSDNGWRIMEESDTEIDQKLESKAETLKLSSINVKSILHQIITNDHVVRMVRNTIEQEKEIPEAVYQPKMTRSKVKQVMEKQGNIPHPWPLTPLKRSDSDSPGFLDMTFSEEEDEEDEEYDPEKEKQAESDEDSESVTSSCLSDLGSPMPSTPSSCHTPSLGATRTPGYSTNEDSQSLLSPMGPPKQPPPTSQRSTLGRKFQKAMEDNDSRTAEEEALIASRTRSKYQLVDTSLYEIESGFVAPDITPDMYDTACDDGDWNDFLNSLVKQPEVSEGPKETDGPGDGGEEGEGEEANDPEYNYLEEADQEYDQEDFRSDRAVRVSKRELNDLMDELLEAYGDVDMLDKNSKMVIRTQAKNSLNATQNKGSPTSQQPSMYQMSVQERGRLDDQLRQHVQLLTQTFVIAQGSKDEHQVAADAARMFVNELQKFACNSEMLTGRPSAYRVCTLDNAMSIVNDDSLWTDIKPVSLTKDYIKQFNLSRFKIASKGQERRSSPECEVSFSNDSLLLPPLTKIQMDVLWNNPVFLFPQLLPRGGFFRAREVKRDRSRVRFLEAEDNLLAIGLEQFKHLSKGKEMIQTFLLPCKTKTQIQFRIKNLSTKSAKDNPVKFFREHLKLPEFPYTPVTFDLSMKKAPKDQVNDLSTLPSWCKLYCNLSPEETEDGRDRRRCKSVTLPTQDTPDDSQCLNRSLSAPATPLNQEDKSGSSGSSGTNVDPMPKRPNRFQRRRLKLTPQKQLSAGFVPLRSSGINVRGDRQSSFTVCIVDKIAGSSDNVMPTATPPLQTNASATDCTTSIPVVTCVAPTIILVNTSAPLQSASGTDVTSSVGSTPGCVMATGMDESSVYQRPLTPVIFTGQVNSPHTPMADTESANSSANNTPVSKSAIEIMASYAPYFVSPSARSPTCGCSDQQLLQETTPPKNRPRYRAVAPKPFTPSGKEVVSPFLDKPKSSPRRKQLQKQARAILPKGFVINTFTSPTKKVASSLMNKALYKGLRSPRKRQLQLTVSPQKGGPRRLLPRPNIVAPEFTLGHSPDPREQEEDGTGSRNDTASEYDTMESECVSDDMLDAEDGDFNENAVVKEKKTHDTESEPDTQSDPEDSQEDMDDEHLANLMEASTTIRFDLRKAPNRLKVNKVKRHREQMLALLSPDILQSDPIRDERDTLFAQAYLHRVRKALRDDLDKYEKFLRLMYEFGQSDQSPVKLYRDICDLLADSADLVHDFAGFLLPEQALDCDCFQANLEFIRARTFLRKLEINFMKSPSQFQKIMKLFAKWYKKASKTPAELRELIEPMLKGQHHLLEEFSLFFPNDRPPDSYMDDFEDVQLDGIGDNMDVDEFEEVTLPNEEEIQGSKRCQCHCHTHAADDTYRKRKKHCYSCCLTVIDGELAYKVNKQTIKKVKVTFYPPMKVVPVEVKPEETQETNAGDVTGTENAVTSPVASTDNTGTSPDWLDAEGAEKENIEHFDVGTSQSPDSPRSRSTSAKSRLPPKKKGHKKYLDLKNLHSWRTSHYQSRNSSAKLRHPVVKVTTGPSTQDSTVIETHCVDSNSSSDILAKAFKTAMIDNNSMDCSSVSMGQNVQASSCTVSVQGTEGLPSSNLTLTTPSSSAFTTVQTPAVVTDGSQVKSPPQYAEPVPATSSSLVTPSTTSAEIKVTKGNPVQRDDECGINVDSLSSVRSPLSVPQDSPLGLKPSTPKLRRITPTPVMEDSVSSSVPSPFETAPIHSPQTFFPGGQAGSQADMIRSCDNTIEISGRDKGVSRSSRSNTPVSPLVQAPDPVLAASGTSSGSAKVDDSSGSSSYKPAERGVSSPAAFSEDANAALLDKFPSQQGDEGPGFQFKAEDSLFNIVVQSAQSRQSSPRDVDQSADAECVNQSGSVNLVDQSDIVNKGSESQKKTVTQSVRQGEAISLSVEQAVSGSRDNTNSSSETVVSSASSDSHSQNSALSAPLEVGDGSIGQHQSGFKESPVSRSLEQMASVQDVCEKGISVVGTEGNGSGQSASKDSAAKSEEKADDSVPVPGNVKAVQSESTVSTSGGRSVAGSDSVTSSKDWGMSSTDVSGAPSLSSADVSGAPSRQPSSTVTSDSTLLSSSFSSIDSSGSQSSGESQQASQKPQSMLKTVISETVYTKTNYKTAVSGLNTENSDDFKEDSFHSKQGNVHSVPRRVSRNMAATLSRSDIALLPDDCNSQSCDTSDKSRTDFSEIAKATDSVAPSLSASVSATSQADSSCDGKQESEAGTQGERSQPGSQTADDSMDTGSSSEAVEEDVSWSWHTDKVILEMCKEQGANEATFQEISDRLGNRTPAQVRGRFATLLQLLADSGSGSGSEDEQ